MAVQRRVTKVGNSAALIIPSAFAESLGLEPGTDVEIDAIDGVLVVVPVKSSVVSKAMAKAREIVAGKKAAR